MTVKHSLKEIRNWLRTIEENKWRKRYKVDAKRITHFVNNGSNSALPESLSRKGESWTYTKERRLAKEYLKKIREDKKLAVNEDNLSILLKKELVKAIREEESDAAKKAKARGDEGEVKETIRDKTVPPFAKMYQKIKTNRR